MCGRYRAPLTVVPCRDPRPIAQQTALVSDSKWRVKARIDGRPVDFTPYRQRSGWLHELDRLVTTLRRDNIPPGRISILLLKNPRPDEEQHLTRLALRRLTEDDVPHLGTATLQSITWSTVSGFKGLENDVIIVAGLTDIESDWHRGGRRPVPSQSSDGQGHRCREAGARGGVTHRSRPTTSRSLD